MANPFPILRERLLRAGVAPRHVRRYLRELADHLNDLTAEEEDGGRPRAEAESAALLRLGPVDDLAGAMIGRRQFQSWCSRAPWATFAVGPLFALGAGYLVACLILWSGWRFLLPESDSPFVPIDGLAVYYFGVGRMIYYVAPVVIGWGIGLLAARQRSKAAWPAAGLLLTALVAGTARVHASRPAGNGGIWHVGMSFEFGSSLPAVAGSLSHVAAVLLLAGLPWLAWRMHRDRSLSA